MTRPLPLLVSVPHAGLWVPPEIFDRCALRAIEVLEDGDVGAAEIFWGLEARVVDFITTGIARAIVDVNRSEDDRSRDGVIKSHTCWNVPVYTEPPPEELCERLLASYYRTYHGRLTAVARSTKALIAIDCHTMAAIGPPVGPDPGVERPAVCLGNADGTCPGEWIRALASAFERELPGERVTINDPFAGGFITRSHGSEMPWLQIEISRAPFAGNVEKAARVRAALERWCATIDGPDSARDEDAQSR